MSTLRRTRLAPETFQLPVEKMRDGYYSDAYFTFTRDVLEHDDHRPDVLMQVFQREQSVLGGIDEALAILKLCSGRRRDDGEWELGWDRLEVRALHDGDEIEPWETVLTIRGDYSLFAYLETLYLGVLARRTLVSRNVRDVVEAAGGKPILYFPARFDHWQVQTGDGWAAHIAGAIGVSTDAQASWWGGKGMGTVPHGLIAAYGGDTVLAARRFADRFADVLSVTVLVDFENDSVRTAPRGRRRARPPPVGRAPRHVEHHGRPVAVARDGPLPPHGRRARAGVEGAPGPRRRRPPGGADRRLGRLRRGPHPHVRGGRGPGRRLRGRHLPAARLQRLHRRRGAGRRRALREGGSRGAPEPAPRAGRVSEALGPIHHVGYVVSDLDAAVAALQATLPLEVTVRETMTEQGVEALMCEGGGGAVELIRPLDADGAIARYMAKRGEGFHHVAFAVDDIEAALDDLRRRGAELIDEHGRRGLGGHTVAFVHPRSTLGVLTELIEAGHDPGGR